MRSDLRALLSYLAQVTGISASNQREDFLERVLPTEHVGALMREGRAWKGANGALRRPVNADCHTVCYEISGGDERFSWWCGFAWAAADSRKEWKLHSWLVDTKDRVIEVTRARRNWYYGKRIQSHERAAWANALREHPPDLPAFIVPPGR